MTLAKRHKLKDWRCFSAYTRSRTLFENSLISFRVLSLRSSGLSLGLPRIAFIASKKIFRLAHTRNRAKRLLAEALRPYHAALLQKHAGRDALFILAKSKVLEASFLSLRAAFEELSKS